MSNSDVLEPRVQPPIYMSRSNTASRPGPEFTGKARLFVNRLVDAEHEYIAQARIISDYAANTFTRCKHPKTNDMIAVQRMWSLTPRTGLLVDSIKRSRRELTIAAVRCAPAKMRIDGWNLDDMESGLLMLFIRIRISRDGCSVIKRGFAFVGQHGLARWYQRNLRQDDTALMDDLAEIFIQRDRLLAGPANFRIPVGYGHWRGSLVQNAPSMKPDVIIRIQTYADNIGL